MCRCRCIYSLHVDNQPTQETDLVYMASVYLDLVHTKNVYM